MAGVDRYLKFLVEKKGSDFHLSTGAAPVFRLQGDMAAASGGGAAPFGAEDVRGLVEEILPERLRAEFAETGDADFAYELEGAGRFRVNVFHDRMGTGAVFRHIPDRIPTFEELGLPPVMAGLCALPKGLVLVTGPTGSGKSTTLAAMIDHVNRTRRDHIVTIEDPIEFVHPNRGCLVNQREVHRHTRSFRSALRAALRQDPDVILVGEMRDLETTEIAIETAETGHLVFGTLHTSTASTTVNRVIDQFPADRQEQVRAMLSVSLKGVVSQALLRRREGGRVAAFEILVANSAVGNLIREGKTHQIPSAIQTGARAGMRLLNDDLMRLVREGVVDADEALRKALDRQDLVGKLRSAGLAP